MNIGFRYAWKKAASRELAFDYGYSYAQEEYKELN